MVYFNSTTASTSIAAPAGSEATLTAARAWRPASPNTATIRSDAPFTHFGASVNSDLMVAVFGDAGRHARAAVSVASLPAGAAIEVDAARRGEAAFVRLTGEELAGY